ncbi:MAG: HAD family phosphatase [Rhodobiaceae bacterium]|nr:HAD family phosphatase [Rhodobiaceae bacterium]
MTPIDPETIGCILFDCDGVLIDSEIVSARVDAELFARHGYPITAEEVAHRFAGMTGPAIYDYVGEQVGRPIPQDVRDATDAEIDRRLSTELELISGADRLLAACIRPRAICSNSSTERLELSLARVGLAGAFNGHVYSALSLPGIRPKPAPDVYAHAADRLGFSADAAIVIEDSPHGVASGKAAGMRVIGFTGGSHAVNGHDRRLIEAGADVIATSMAEAAAILGVRI